MHSDFYFFGGKITSMLTCWVALGDYTVDDGTLVVCERSHKLPGLDKPLSEESKQELPESFLSSPPTARLWRTADFQAGDAVVFDIRLVHASSTNLSDQFRISTDTRWLPTSHIPEALNGEFHHFPGRPPSPMSVSSSSAPSSSAPSSSAPSSSQASSSALPIS